MANGFKDQGHDGGGLPELPNGKLAYTNDLNLVHQWLRGKENAPATVMGGPRGIPRLLVVVQVTSNAGGGGKYFAKLIENEEGDISPDDDLVASDLGTLGDDETVLFLNLEEVGQTTHVLTEDSQTPYALGVVRTQNSDDEDNWLVVAGLSIASTDCDAA